MKKKDEPILIGLNNIGATCYMNASLQCFSNTKKLSEYFLNHYINKKPKKFEHMANIAFPLSFQQNAGATVGDTDGIWSPAIGVDL